MSRAWPSGSGSPCPRGARRRTKWTVGARVLGSRERRESQDCRGTTWEIILNFRPASRRNRPGVLLADVRVPVHFGDDDAVHRSPQHRPTELPAGLPDDLPGDIGNVPRYDAGTVHALDEKAHVPRTHPLVIED